MSQYASYVTEESVQSSISNLKFGLNQNVNFVKLIKVSPEDSNSEQGAVDFVFNVHGSEIKRRIFPIVSVKDKETGAEIRDPNNEQFKAAISKQQGWFTSFFKVFTTEEKIKAAIANGAANKPNFGFFDYIIAQYNIVPKDQYAQIKIDLFLEYITGKDNKKYLTVPNSRIHGKFITKAAIGDFTEVINSDGLCYVNNEGVHHEIQRSKWWLDNADAAKKDNGGSPISSLANAAVMSAPGLAAMASQTVTPPVEAAGAVDDMDW